MAGHGRRHKTGHDDLGAQAIACQKNSPYSAAMPAAIPPSTPEPTAGKPPVSLLALFIVFLRIGILSIGGGFQAYLYRDLVESKWIEQKEYLIGFAVAQLLPGANPVNLALYFGLKLRGGAGASVAVLGMLVPSFCIILLLGFVYRQLSAYPVTHAILVGIAAVGIAATLAMGIKISARLDRTWASILVALVTFAAVGIFRLPMVPVMAVMVPLSVGLAYALGRPHAG
jgi:chromate transporter